MPKSKSRIPKRATIDAVPTSERDDSAFVMAMMTRGGGMVITDAQGREVAAGQIADRLAELSARLAVRPAEPGDGWADPRRRRKRTDADKARDEGKIAAHLAEHPDATRDEVAEASGIARAHVSASVAWKSHKAMKRAARKESRTRSVGGVGDPSVHRFGGDEDEY